MTYASCNVLETPSHVFCSTFQSCDLLQMALSNGETDLLFHLLLRRRRLVRLVERHGLGVEYN